MRNDCLKPCFFAWSLSEPGPDHDNEEKAQILEQDASTETQSLNDQVVEEVVGGFRKVGGESRRDRGGICNDGRDGRDNSGRDRGDQNELNE